MNLRLLRRPFAVGRVCFVLASLACSSLDNLTITQKATATVPSAGSGAGLLDDLGFEQFDDIDITTDQSFQNKGVSREDIDSVKIRSVVLTITVPSSGQDFSFIDDVKFYASSPTQPKVLIASGGPFAAGLREVGLDVEDVDLANYAEEDSIAITTEVSGDSPQEETTIEAVIELDVDVNVSGALCGS